MLLTALRSYPMLALMLGLGTYSAAEPATDAAATGPETLTVAVAANFRSSLETLLAQLDPSPIPGTVELRQYRIVSGSTGTLYAQITQGAPFDIFFAADTQRPLRLVEDGHAKHDSLRHYASGILALAYRSDEQSRSGKCDGLIDTITEFAGLLEALGYGASSSNPMIATANPRIAPYGAAASEVLDTLAGHSEATASPKRILGRNVLQAQQFLETGHVDLALVAYSLKATSKRNDIVFCPFAATMHAPIAQALVVVDRPRSASQNALLEKLLTFLASGQARNTISALGYR